MIGPLQAITSRDDTAVCFAGNFHSLADIAAESLGQSRSDTLVAGCASSSRIANDCGLRGWGRNSAERSFANRLVAEHMFAAAHIGSFVGNCTVVGNG